jgi:hypothetical protein
MVSPPTFPTTALVEARRNVATPVVRASSSRLAVAATLVW